MSFSSLCVRPRVFLKSGTDIMWDRIKRSITFSLNAPISDWNAKRVWIIGASSGIGAAIAKDLLDQGARVILTARREQPLYKIGKFRSNALVIPLDVRDESQWQRAYTRIQNKWGGIDLFIYCAATYQPVRSWEVIPEIADNTLDINLAGIYRALAVALPSLLEQKQGGIALIGSVAGYMGLPNASVYGPSKAALINLAEILYGDLHPRGLDVYLINPGFVDTGLTQKNQFKMPSIVTTEQASRAILKAMAQGKFEIHFPVRFTGFMKVLALLPYRLRFYLFRRIYT